MSTMRARLKQLVEARVVFRPGTEADLDRFVEIGYAFFDESELGENYRFDPDRLRDILSLNLQTDAFRSVVMEVNGQVEGIIFWHMERAYTVEPMAVQWLFWVAPEYRYSPAPRMLLEAAQAQAKEDGAPTMYAGAMSGSASTGTLANLYKRAGFEPLFWGRKYL